MIGQKNKGFTIVEVIMFLAVSGFIFVIAAIGMSGQLSKAESKDAINQLESTIRGTLNDVSNGYYPEFNNTSFDCERNLNGSSDTRGEVQNCFFAGKSITFGPANKCDSGTADIIVDTYITTHNTSSMPTYSDITPAVCGLEVTENYPASIKLIGSSKTFYILNTNYSTDPTSFNTSGGANGVVLDKLGGSGDFTPLTATSNDNVVCFQNGSENSSLDFGINGVPSVSITYNDKSNCGP